MYSHLFIFTLVAWHYLTCFYHTYILFIYFKLPTVFAISILFGVKINWLPFCFRGINPINFYIFKKNLKPNQGIKSSAYYVLLVLELIISILHTYFIIYRGTPNSFLNKACYGDLVIYSTVLIMHQILLSNTRDTALNKKDVVSDIKALVF